MGYADSGGMRAPPVPARLCREKGGRLVPAALPPECRPIVDMGGFASVIGHFATREAALG